MKLENLEEILASHKKAIKLLCDLEENMSKRIIILGRLVFLLGGVVIGMWITQIIKLYF